MWRSIGMTSTGSRTWNRVAGMEAQRFTNYATTVWWTIVRDWNINFETDTEPVPYRKKYKQNVLAILLSWKVSSCHQIPSNRTNTENQLATLITTWKKQLIQQLSFSKKSFLLKKPKIHWYGNYVNKLTTSYFNFDLITSYQIKYG